MAAPKEHGSTLFGTFAGPATVGPFRPAMGRIVCVDLSGVFTGSIKLLRSTDGGTTKLPLKIGGAVWGEFTVQGCEQVWEEWDPFAEFYLESTLSSGSVDYRVFN